MLYANCSVRLINIIIGGEKVFCTKCGANINEGDRFCKTCGTTVGTNTVFNNQTAPQPQNYSTYNTAPGNMNVTNTNYKKTGNKKLILIISIAAVLLVVCGIILFNVLTPAKPVDVVKKFVNAMDKKDAKTLISCVDPELEKSFDVDEFFKAEYTVKIVKILSENINGDRATVVADTVITQKDANGKAETLNEKATFTLSKINGSWRIVDMGS